MVFPFEVWDRLIHLYLIDGKRINGSLQDYTFPNGFGESIISFMPPIAAIENRGNLWPSFYAIW